MNECNLSRSSLAAILLAIPAAPACEGAGQGPDSDLDGRLRPLVEHVVERGVVPGLQIAVVTADGRRWDGAFGVADLETGAPVRPDSRFYIASTSKALTGLAAARLAERGVLDLDEPIATALPQARFPAGYDASAATVRDFLTHTHGLGQAPSSFRIAFTGQYTNERIFDLLASHVVLPSREFRYSNVSYDVIGLLLDPETTRGWKAVVEREVLEPLGMTRTTAYRSRIPDGEIAWPHDVGPDGYRRILLGKDDANMGPAGGHFSTALDLSRLVEAHLSRGSVVGAEGVSPEVIAETQRPQAEQSREFMFYRRHAWGIGWDIGRYDGALVIHRPGGFAGYYSNVAFLPEHGFGVAVLANGGPAGARAAEIAATAIYDELRGRDSVLARLELRLEELATRIEDAATRAAEGPELAARLPLPAEVYAGTYANDGWGEITVETDAAEARLVARAGVARGTLRPLAESAGRFASDLFQNGAAEFTLEDGRATELEVLGVTFARR